jgi:hypothetical protein
MAPPPFTIEVRRGGEVRKLSYLEINLPDRENAGDGEHRVKENGPD